jgi:peptide/nickel transport system permease protein
VAVAGTPGAVPGGRRPSPRIAQAARTWHFMRRNTLAMVGLTIVILFAILAVFAVTTSINWDSLQPYCSADYGPDNSHSGYLYQNNSSGQWESHGPYNPGTQCSGNLVCTYTVTPPPNAAAWCGGQWYPIPYQGPAESLGFANAPHTIAYPGAVGPTFNLGTFNSGPLPLGSLETAGESSPSGLYSIYDGVVRGTDWSLMISLAIVITGAGLGLLIGAIAGLWGGLVDEALMRLVDIFLSIPIILFVIVVVEVVHTDIKSIAGLSPADASVLLLVLGFAAVWWPFYARIVRGQVLVVREQKYVEAARASGASRPRILVRHVIPNSTYPVFVQFSLDVGTIPLLLGGLVYLKFPIFASQYFPEWGSLAALSVLQLPGMLGTCELFGCVIPWWQLFFPGLTLFLWAISVNLLSDGLRDALDPRLRR